MALYARRQCKSFEFKIHKHKPNSIWYKKSKAKELGFTDKTIKTKDIVNAISSGKLKFSMSNPTSTNSGASAYLGFLYTLAGNPEVLKKKIYKIKIS